jgi:hypothetical protein
MMHNLHTIPQELLFFYTKSISSNMSIKNRVTGKGALVLIAQLGAERFEVKMY